ncbi:DNA helicase [Beutenbergia cavernae DSM 12333]|uniref:DNA helicase n=2 Tax=Beutenbergia TaxID=84756 RepID=C5BZI8_BEUC1|nr:DNA helicase [Beutenbergia cavernae DSM 12333]
MTGEAGEPTEPGAGRDHEAEAATRAAAVSDAVARWREALTALGGDSALADIDALGDAGLDLSAAHPGGIAQLFAGRPTRLSNLVREPGALGTARRRARLVLARSDELAQRYGLAATSVALGVATWTPADPEGRAASEGEGELAAAGSEPWRAPVLLRPVHLSVPAHGTDAEVELALSPRIEINPVLARALGGGAGRLERLVVERTQRGALDLRALLAEVDEILATALPGVRVDERVVLGSFAHPGQLLAEDLDAERLAGHDVVAALAGDDEAAAALESALPPAADGDRDPAQERGVGDLDAGQRRVLDAVAMGGHLFVDAPPGADVVGTITAIIADAAASGRSVLHVPGTRRAGAALAETVAAVGIGELVLDLTSDADRSRVAAEAFGARMAAPVPEVDDDAVAALRLELGQVHRSLVAHVRALHEVRSRWGVSAYDALQALAALTAQRPGPRTEVRLDAAILERLDAPARKQAGEELARAGALGAFQLRRADSPWYGVRLASAEEATRAVETVNRLAARTLPGLRRQIAAAAAQTGLAPASSLAQWREQLTMLEGVRRALDVFQPMVFERSAADLVAATAPRAERAQHGAPLPWRTRRRLRRQAKDLLRPGRHVTDLHAELVHVQAQRDVWRLHCPAGGWPRLPESLDALETATQDVSDAVASVEEVLAPTLPAGDGATSLVTLPLAGLEDHLLALAADESVARALPERTAALARLIDVGLGDLVDDLADRRVPTSLVGAELDLAWWASVLDVVLASDSALANAGGEDFLALTDRWRALDRGQVASLVGPVRRATVRHLRGVMREHEEQAQGLYALAREARRGSGDTFDLREMARVFAPVAGAVVPCWSVPPMLVPQVLEPGARVDLLVLDNVQNLPTEQAVAAIGRARQVVVLGDSRRAGGGVVDALAPLLPRLTLPTDRGEEDEHLTAFLVRHGYAEVLVPVPAPPGPSRIRLDLVDGRGLAAPGADAVESVAEEVARVVDVVVDHALTRPEESLAVVALNARHADRVREAVAGTVAHSPAVAEFFDAARPEPFTVVDVEAASGLRRDAVVLTLGFGKTPHGRVLHRFGAVSGPRGASLLVEAIAASRSRLVVVSCIAPDEFDRGRLRSEGPLLLHDLLEFAALDGALPPSTDDAPPDPLLVDLAERLWRMGLTVVPQYGPAGGVRVPLAIGHPELPGRLLLAVLTDDAEYVASPSLRTRDRHRIERLERRGWTVRMLPSTAVFMDPQGEAQRICDLVTELVRSRRTTGSVHVPVVGPPERLDDEEGPDEDVPDVADPAQTGTSAAPARPDLEAGLPIGAYTDDQLDELLRWLDEGEPREDEDLLAAVRTELGIARRGGRVDAVLGAALARLRTGERRRPTTPAAPATPASTEPPVIPDRAWEDVDRAWGDDDADDDDRLRRERPPHWG